MWTEQLLLRTRYRRNDRTDQIHKALALRRSNPRNGFADNHECFVVEMNGQRFGLMFSDGVCYVGLRMSWRASGDERQVFFRRRCGAQWHCHS